MMKILNRLNLPISLGLFAGSVITLGLASASTAGSCDALPTSVLTGNAASTNVASFGTLAPATQTPNPYIPAPIVLTTPDLVSRDYVGRSHERCQVGPIPKPFPVDLRIGAMVSPRLKFAGGADVTFPVGLLPSLSTRIDADAIVSANFHGVSTLVPVTIDQIYSKGLIFGSKLYVGAGVGPYIGNVTRLGGKVFVGGNIAGSVGLEGGLDFPGFGVPLVLLQARIGL